MRLIALFCTLLGVSAGLDASELKDVLECMRPSLVRVQFNYVDQNGAKTQSTAIGTAVPSNNLILISGDLMPRHIPDAYFQDFRVALVSQREQDPLELDAELLVRDYDLPVAAIRLVESLPEGIALPAVEFDTEPLEPGAQIVAFALLPENYHSSANFVVGHVVKRIDLPEPLLVVTQSTYLTRLGPVCNMRGEVVGFTIDDPLRLQRSTGAKTATESAPVPVVLPASRIIEFLKDPLRKSKRPWLGISDMQALTDELATVYGLKNHGGGVIVGRVLEGQPANLAGLQTDDIIVQLDEQKIAVRNDAELYGFIEQLKKLTIGQHAAVKVLRPDENGLSALELSIPIGERPKEEAEAQRIEERALGIVLRELVYYDLLRLDLPQTFTGLYVQYVRSGSSAAIAGLRRGDILTRIDNRDLNGNTEETFALFQQTMVTLKESQKNEFVFYVSRGRKGQNSAVVKLEADWKQ